MTSGDASLLAAYAAAEEVGVDKADVEKLLRAVKAERTASDYWPEGFLE